MKKILCFSFALLYALQSIAQNTNNYDDVFHDYNAYNPDCNFSDEFSSNTSFYSEFLDDFNNPMAIILLGKWETSKANIPSCIYVGSIKNIYTTYRIQAKTDFSFNDRSDCQLTTLNIGAGVHEIGKNAFKNFQSLENVFFEAIAKRLKGVTMTLFHKKFPPSWKG